MKIIAATAMSLLAGLGRLAGCDAPRPESVAVPVVAQASAPEAHQSAYGVSLDAQAACSVFTVRIWNSNNSPRTATISVDGSYHSTLRAASQSYAEKTIYFANNSGDHNISVFWAGGTSAYRTWTNCAP